jgi:hypothetical protein
MSTKRLSFLGISTLNKMMGPTGSFYSILATQILRMRTGSASILKVVILLLTVPLSNLEEVSKAQIAICGQ